MFEVGFSVQIFGFDEADAFLERRVEHVHITWEKLIFIYLYQHADFDVSRLRSFELAFAERQLVILSAVFLVVRLVAFAVFEGVLDRRDSTDDCNAQEGGQPTVRL